MRSFGLDIERNKRGQTSRPIIGTEIQTRCDINTGSSSSDNVLLLRVTGGLMYLWSDGITLIVVFVFVLLCLITSIFSYTKIYLKLRDNQAQVQDHVHQEGTTLNIERYKKTVSSISWVQFTLIVCYVPYGIESIIWINGISTDYTWLSTPTLVYLNSSLNPFLYCWKMREVRQAVKDTVREFCCREAS